MRRSSARRATAIIASAILVPLLASSIGAAATTPLWIEQNGNGAGDTAPMITGFTVRDVLFNGARFPLPNGTTQRPGMKKYAAYGATPISLPPPGEQVLAEIALSVSDEGTSWSEPTQLTVRDTDTAPDVPIIVNDPRSGFALSFGDLPQAIMDNGTGGSGAGRLGLQFALYYRDFEDGGNEASDSIEGIHVAVSADGALFEFDQSLLQAPDVEPVLGGGWKSQTYGPSQIIFLPNGSTSCHAGAAPANFPWNCRAIMLYNAVGDDGRERIGLAGSGDGVSWRGMAAPLLDVGAPGSWDDEVASYGKVVRTCGGTIVGYTGACSSGEQWVLYYQGGRLPDNGCGGGNVGCFSIGIATAANGLAFGKVAHNPVTPASLFEQADPGLPASLWYPSPVNDGAPSSCATPGNTPKIFLTAIRGDSESVGDPARGFWQALHGTAPSAGPTIRIDNPINGNQPVVEDRLTMYLTDTLGTPGLIGVDISTLSVDIDGTTSLALKISKSIVGALKFQSFKVTAGNIFANLAEGAHALNVSVKDLEGNETSTTVSFTLDRSAPETTMSVPGTSPKIGLPLSSIGTFEGETIDALSPLLGLRAIVRNPLGQTKIYEARETCGVLDSRTNGFALLEESAEGKVWKWRWVAPTLDLHTAIPGPYNVTVVGFDVHNNIEKAGTQNTASVLFL